jgi:hypothetical protein
MKCEKSLIIIFVITIAMVSGCLDTKEAEPAIVDQSTLNELGWIQSGNVQKDSINQEIGGTKVAINTAQMSYYDKVLADDINQQMKDTGRSVSTEEERSISSQIITMRLTLPAGITLPNSILAGIMDSLVQKMATENNIKNFHEVDEETVKIRTGTSIKAKSYEGYIESENGENLNIGIKGIIASWSSNKSTIIAIGIIPGEDFGLENSDQIGIINDAKLDIDKEKEYQEILTLIQNVE